MNKEEYNKTARQIHTQINDLQSQLKQLTKQYCAENAPFKIGDKVRLKGKEGIISFVKLDTWSSEFEYKWTPIKKDGSIGCEKNIYSFDTKYIEKI